jgi:hypothetical protein
MAWHLRLGHPPRVIVSAKENVLVDLWNMLYGALVGTSAAA